MSRDPRACVGPCSRRYREAWDAYDQALADWTDSGDTCDPPAEPDVSCNFGELVWCLRCQSAIRSALSELDDLAALLDSWADGHRGASSGEGVSRGRSQTGTVSPIADMLDELYGDLAAFESKWRRYRGYPPSPRRARTGHARTLVIAFLLEHLPDVLAHPRSGRFGNGVLGWHRRLLAATKSEPVVRRRPGRCPRCQMVNVLQSRDDGYTECRGRLSSGRPCGRLLSEEDYERDVIGAADSGVVAESRAAS